MQNFGKIKNSYNGILAEALVSKNEGNTSLFKTYVKTIKENSALRAQFLVYDNIENKIEENEMKALKFVEENIKLLRAFKSKDLLEANTKLAKAIAIDEVDYNKKSLHEDITTLVFTENNPTTVDVLVDATTRVVEYIKNNKKNETVSEAIELPSSMLTTLMVDKYNEKYASLDESDKKILKALIESTPEEKSTVYRETIRECIDLINERLNTSDVEAKDKLLRVKDKLLNDKVDIAEDFEKKISKLVDLKNSLK